MLARAMAGQGGGDGPPMRKLTGINQELKAARQGLNLPAHLGHSLADQPRSS